MQRAQLFLELHALADRAKKSPDLAVQQSSVVLYGLCGAISAGDEFLEAFIDKTVETIQNQLQMVESIMRDRDSASSSLQSRTRTNPHGEGFP